LQATSSSFDTNVIEFSAVSKTFGGTTALDDVSFSLERGKVHAVMGENGAGKSTLGRVLAGILQPDRGEVIIDGRARHFGSPREARHAGIGMVHQELALCPDLTIAENLSLGAYPVRNRLFLDRISMQNRARSLLGSVGAEIAPDRLVRDLPVALQQVVQIAGAVGTGADILVFDEPTSSLSDVETGRLFDLISSLRDRGVTILYVSHRMSEVFDLCDTISVLRDGRFVGTLPRREADQDRVVQMMIGRQLEAYFPGQIQHQKGEELLRVESLSSPGRFSDISFSVHAGEIVGFAGLVGSGRSEVATAVLGLDPHATGTVSLTGKDLSRLSPRKRMRAGIGFIPEDRKKQGLALPLSCRINFSLTMLDTLRRFLFIDQRKEQRLLQRSIEELAIKTPGIDLPVAHLSGGNQQKIVLAKWLACSSRILFLDEPTRGVDVGAKASIHALMERLAVGGKGLVLISSELPELLHLSTRILVMREGRLVGECPRSQATQDRLLRMMSGLPE
jgi:ABC-type sugar transport system ATPase subunit